MYVCICVDLRVHIVCVRVCVSAYVNAFRWTLNLCVSMRVLYIKFSIKESIRNNRLTTSFSLRISSIHMTGYLVIDILGYLLLFEQ